MRNIFVIATLMAACSTAMSQGYVGAVVALSRIDGACQGQDTCDHKGHAIRAYFGSALSPDHQVDLGIGKLSSVEVGFVNFGKGGSTGAISYIDPTDSDPTTNQHTRPGQRSTTANALTLAAVSTFPFGGGVTGVVRTGVAYVSSTVRYYDVGVENGSETATKLKPYLGLGVEYEVVDNLKIVGAFDWTQFDVAGNKSSLKSFGLGAQVGF